MQPNPVILCTAPLILWGCTASKSTADFCDLAAADGYRNIVQDADTREYLLNIPDTYSGSAVPLVLNFHGSGGCADDYREAESDLSIQATNHNFLLAYPQGVLDVEGLPEWRPVADDARGIQDNDFVFVEQIIADISKEYSVKSEQIYATGLSNGGMMAYGLACRRSNIIAAAGIMSGTMLTDSCDQNEYTSIVHFQGTADTILPMEGNTDFPAVTAGIEYWVAHNNTTTSTSDDLDNGNVHRDTYSDGMEGTSVVLYTIQNGQHVWFTDDIDGQSPNQILWDFLSQYTVTGRTQEPNALER